LIPFRRFAIAALLLLKKNIPLFILSWISIAIHAQQFSYIHYDEKDGLPSTTVYDVSQDEDGFVWFATENGLTRFDGAQFKTLSTTDGLPDNSILRLHGDKKGRVYFSPFTHTPYYYYKGKVHKLKVAPEYVQPVSLILRFFDFGDQMLINDGTQGSYLVDKNDSLIPLHHIFRNLPGPVTVSMPTGNYLMAGTIDTVYYINLTDSSVTPRPNTNYGAIGTLLQNGGFHRRGKVPSNMLFINGWANDYLWYETDANNVLSFYSRVTGEFLRKIHVEKPSKCFIDTENNLWITTLGHGVYRFPSFEFRLAKVNNAGEIFSLNSNNHDILIGADYSKLLTLNTAKSHEPAVLWDLTKYLTGSANVVSVGSNSNRITRIIVSKDTTYIGADAFLLKIIKDRPPIFSPVFPVKDIDTFGNRLLVSTGRTVVRLDAISLKMIDTLLHSRTTAGVQYNGDYYIATLGGLLKIKSSDNSVIDLSKQNPELSGRITAIRKGNDNDLWITNSGKGLIHYRNDTIIRVFGKRTGLTSDLCTSLFIDGNNIWVGTNKGLNKIDISEETPRVTSYTIANGLASNFVNTVFVNGDTVYAGSSAGLTYFNKHLEKTSSICRLHILEISQGNRELALDSIYHFPYSAMNIRIAFTAISFKSAGDNTYYYQLEGLDNGWNTTSNTFINYATLPPGKYRFVLKAVNKFGVESETRSITIVIAHPWWQSWWVWPAGALLIAAIVFLVARNKINSIRKQEKLKRESEAKLVLLEQQALQAQMNPHFIFNCLNSIQAYILKLDAAGASKYLNAFASMIRQTLDFSSKLLITVADEVKYIHTYLQLEKLRYKEKFNYAIEVDDEIDQAATLLPGMLLQPYIENSLRHGIQHRPDNDGFITLKIMAGNDNGIVCQVIDNGIGRARSEALKSTRHIEYQSKGTLISAKRIAAINRQLASNILIKTEDILDANGEVAGTVVSIEIPDLNKRQL
jgi:hypothetical protein